MHNGIEKSSSPREWNGHAPLQYETGILHGSRMTYALAYLYISAGSAINI